ncbi:alpha/beta hydrolase [Sphaerisporangium aureirubrum]|uniref:Alpha/beta hydrolase n=1 Tax=Sphaerisporangium aureirubrum TaxID=1544736 RepID=A0ABW1N8A1_9ACTN
MKLYGAFPVRLAVAAAMLVPMSLVAAGGARAAVPSTFAGIRWASCPAPSPIQGSGGKPRALRDGTPWECATLRVPLDHAAPGRGSIDLALIRARAKPKAGQKRIGSLVFNFGGPGGSGVATLPLAAATFLKLHERYDLVSFDPRGVGESAGVRCLSDEAYDAMLALDASPDGAAEQQALLDGSRDFAAACKANSGRVLPYVGTRAAARDMDLLRRALGDRKLYYYGASYGTELGGVYAHLFPANVGRMVFDAVVDPTADSAGHALAQAKGFQLALRNFLKDCATRSRCATGKDAGRGAAQITALLKRLDERSLPTRSGRVLTQSHATYGIASALYSKETWKWLDRGLGAAKAGEGDLLLLFADALYGRDEKGRYNNLQPANTAINCADSSERYTVADVRRRMPAFRKASPVFGEFLAWSILQCTGWPVAGESRTVNVSAKGAAPILVVGNTGDPATPYAGARRMATGLGKGVGVELIFKGQGHGAYGTNSCVTGRIDTYLLTGKTPRDRTVCG